ncbi:MAG: hypothetical protein BWK78_05350, partial [Thiotrichaceae bacterium IS1]
EGYFQRGQFELAVQYWEGKRSKLFIGKEEGSTTYQLKNLSNSSSLTVAQQLRLAEAYQQLGRLKDALKVLQEANFHIQKIQDSTRQTEFQAGLHSQLGDVYLAMGSLESQDCKGVTTQTRQAVLRENQQRAEKSLYLAKGFAEKINHPLLQASILNKLGNMLAPSKDMAQKDYEEALKKYEEAKELAEKGLAEQDNLLKDENAQAKHEYAKELIEQGKWLKAKILINLAQLKVNLAQFKVSQLHVNAQNAITDAQGAIRDASGEVKNLSDSNSHDKSFALIALARFWEKLQKLQSSENPHSSPVKEPEFCSTESSFKQQLQPRQSEEAKRFELLTQALEANKIQEDRRAVSYAKGYLARLYLEKGCYSHAKELTEQAIFYAQTYPQVMTEDVTKKLWGYPELLFQWEWQLGKILKAQGQSEPIKAYGRAAGYLEEARKNYASTSSIFRENGEAFYLERADLLLQTAKETKTGEDDKNPLLKEAIDSIESRQEAGLRNYFQDDCVTQKNPKGEERQLQEGEALFYPVVFDDRIELVLKFSEDNIKQEVYKIPFSDLKSEVNSFKNGIRSKMSFVVDSPAKELYNWLIKPISNQLQNTKVLLIVPSSELLHVPFSALINEEDGKYLIESARYAFAILPSWKLVATTNLSEERASLSGLQQIPKYYVPSPEKKIAPLKFVREEVKELIKILTHHDVLLDEDFTADNLMAKGKQQVKYSIIHFSTHGEFVVDANKSILYTYDNSLSLDQLEDLIGNISYQPNGLDLLVLSACETALGAELGMAGIGIKAGATSTLGTLWVVDERSTALLTTLFYWNWKKDKTKAEALREAQLCLLTGLSTEKCPPPTFDLKFLDETERKRFKEPYYWASFLLIGGWLK